MSWLDWLVAVLGVANIVLIVRRSIWNFPVALVMVSIFGVRLAE